MLEAFCFLSLTSVINWSRTCGQYFATLIWQLILVYLIIIYYGDKETM